MNEKPDEIPSDAAQTRSTIAGRFGRVCLVLAAACGVRALVRGSSPGDGAARILGMAAAVLGVAGLLALVFTWIRTGRFR